jgi:Family of unknown function (DUF6193)
MLYSSLNAESIPKHGLTPTLQQIFDEMGADLRVVEVDVHEPCTKDGATINKGSRSGRVCIMKTGKSHGAFSLEFENPNVEWGFASAWDLMEAAHAAVKFLVDEAPLAELKPHFARYYFRKYRPDRATLTPEERVTQAWERMEERMSPDEKQMDRDEALMLAPLLPLLREAAKRPALRRLYPHTSLDSLSFSRTMGYPCKAACPWTRPLGDGRFRVMASDSRTVLGEGDAAQIADLLVAHLSPD